MLRILLAEDDGAMRTYLARVLSNAGYSIQAVGCGTEAAPLLAKEHFDLLLSDIVMPEMDGQNLARKLLAAYPQLKVMFMSGYTADVISFTGVEERSFHFLQKPFSRHDLTAMVREILDSAAP